MSQYYTYDFNEQPWADVHMRPSRGPGPRPLVRAASAQQMCQTVPLGPDAITPVFPLLRRKHTLSELIDLEAMGTMTSSPVATV